MGRLSLRGVLIGGIIDVVASVVFSLPLAIYVVFKLDLSRLPPNRMYSAIISALHGNLRFHIGQSIIGLTCSAIAGYVAAQLAKHDELLNAGFSSFLCVALFLYSVASGKDAHPLPLEIATLLAGPAFGVLGGYLRVVQKRKRIDLTYAGPPDEIR